MENTLLVGDHLIMSRIGYDIGLPFTPWHVPLWRNPKRQQIVIIRAPQLEGAPDLIKRVIGLPGDTVEIRDGHVFINGTQLDGAIFEGTRQSHRASPAPGKCHPQVIL